MLESLRRQVLTTALGALEAGFVRVSEGNISARDPETGYIAVTPTSVPYREMTPDDVVVIDVYGRLIWCKPGRAPTSETPMHTLLYRERPDVGAVVHTHSPYAVILATAQRAIPPITASLALTLGGGVPLAPYARFGTEEFGRGALAAMCGGRAALLGSHGAVAVGPDLGTAAAIAGIVEDAARLYYMASQVGQPFVFPPEEVQWLADLGRKLNRKEQ